MSAIKRTLGESLFDVFNAIFMIVFCFLCIYPFIYILNISISDGISSAKYGLHLIPKGITFYHYTKIFATPAIPQSFINSIVRTVLGTSLMVVFTIMGAYPMSKSYMPNRKFWTTFIVISMFFNGGLIPNYFLVKSLHLTDTVWSLILPGLINTFYLIVARNFIMTVPESLEEAAKIDGANEIRILISVVLPICKPIIATVALWAAVYHWNAWFDCMIYITDANKSVLQVVLFRIINSGSYDLVTGDFANKQTYPEVVKACTIIVTVLPIVMVYPFLQKYFIKGMLIGSVKG